MNVTEIIKENFQQLASSSALTDEINNIGIVQDFGKDIYWYSVVTFFVFDP